MSVRRQLGEPLPDGTSGVAPDRNADWGRHQVFAFDTTLTTLLWTATRAE